MLVKSQVKYIQSLSQKKLRDEETVFVAEGPKIINELLEAPHIALQHLYALPAWIAEQHNLPPASITAIDESELVRISFLQTPNQVLGIFKKPVFPANRPLTGSLTLVLDAIQDPGNMGTIIRCADWFGIDTIIASPESADAFNPKVVQATMGSIARVQVLYQELEPLLQQATVAVYAALLEGEPLQSLHGLQEGIIMIGNESKGIRPSLLPYCQHRITIPRVGKAESLNAAVATGIILSHL